MTRAAQLGVVGAGAWGTALALVAARAGARVTLWARESDVVEAIGARGENTLFLPGVKLPDAITATNEIAALASCEAALLTVPTQHLAAIASALAPHLAKGAPLLLCAKGIAQTSLQFPDEIVAAAAPGHPLAVLSGPSFAADVARGLPTAVTLATPDAELGRRWQSLIGLPHFRPYLSDDVKGAEIGGAVKNVLAIACGIAVGRGLGDSARAALITRGFAEMSRLGLSLGAKLETLIGLSGLGDLVLTCSSPQSRNMSLGIAMGQGRTAQEVLAERRSVAEGAATAPALVALAAKTGVEMPIAAAVDQILRGETNIDAAIGALLSRPFKAEGLG
jgi:glycerol-3-phosphate dehydrogenase (NAD(P)+)